MEMMDKLIEALATIRRRLEPLGVPWLVGGSTGLLLQGVPLDAAPRDLDIYADDEGAKVIHAALAAYSIDEQTEDRSGLYRSVLSHYVIHDVKVELVGGFEVKAYGCFYKVEAAYLFHHYAGLPHGTDYSLDTVRLMPLEHELVFNVLRNRPDRYESIAQVIQARNQEPGLTGVLEELLIRHCWTEEMDARLRELVAGNGPVGRKGVAE
ncbi:nucleotidyltransferase domain-containing protein [Paenibacillus rigui]|uniref:nucleotidyltransferase domain-containing protein n=1 Tax=Paenibacillus rigui TaxID=554312 RepID=UPI0015C5A360|nr:hypothetical protein [Paenibacillus rigui]